MCSKRTRCRTPPGSPSSTTTAPPLSHQAEVDFDSPLLEIVFSFNVAGSHGPMPPASKRYLKGLIRCLHAPLLEMILASNSSKTRIAIFAHGVHDSLKRKGDLRHVDFTDDVSVLRHFVDKTSLMAWGSVHHCYELVLRKARALSWTPRSRRVMVLFGGTSPHFGLHPRSDELIHWSVEARCLAQRGISVYTVQIKTDSMDHQFYPSVADITQGCHVVLELFTEIDDVIMAIVSHLEGPAALEALEQELVDRDQDDYTTDIARLFCTLRHQHEKVTSGHLILDEDPATPQGSDFDGDDDDNDEKSSFKDCQNDVMNTSKRVTVSSENSRQQHEVTEHYGVTRRASLRLKLKQNIDLNLKREQNVEADSMMTHTLPICQLGQLPKRPKLDSDLVVVTATIQDSWVETSDDASKQRTPLKRQPTTTVSFIGQGVDDRKPVTSSSSPDNDNARSPDRSTRSRRLVLTKAKSAPTLSSVVKKRRREVETATTENAQKINLPNPQGSSSLLTSEVEGIRFGFSGSNPVECPTLRKGVTTTAGRAIDVEERADVMVNGARKGFDHHHRTADRVYMIDREAPMHREHVSSRAFALRHLPWSPWTLVISPALPAPQSKTDLWEPRLQGGYRRKHVIDDDDDDNDDGERKKKAGGGLYEVALRMEGVSTSKRVVYFKFLPELRQDIPWEEQLLGHPDLQREVSAMVTYNNCQIFLRRAPSAQNASRRSQNVVQTALRKYDYAWNDVQCFRRVPRPVDFFS